MSMTPETFNKVLQDLAPLGISHRNIADLFGYRSHATVYQWKQGKTKIPANVEAFLMSMWEWWQAFQGGKSGD